MDFGSLFNVVKVALVMIVMISILVAAHEYGHYLFARIFKMGVEEFAIGFGKKPIWTWMRKTYEVEGIPGPAGAGAQAMSYPTDGSGALAPEPAPTPSATKLTVTETTDFTVRPWPLGGFVRIKGMMPEDDGSETKIPGGFYSKAPWKRFLVLLAGPLFSVLAGCIILFSTAVLVGAKEDEKRPILGMVQSGMPAAKAGLAEGDKIVELDGQKIESFVALAAYIREHPEQNIKVTFEREGVTKTTTVTPEKAEKVPVYTDDPNAAVKVVPGGKIGIGRGTVRVPVAAGKALEESAIIPVKVIGGLVSMLRTPSQFKENVGGPGTIAMATNEAAKRGVVDVIELAAILSISVGIFNLLPMPPLDGGQMLVAVAEMLRRGKRLSMKVQQAFTAVGLALVMMLVVSVILVDVGRITGGDKKDAKPSQSAPAK
ncbi:MAG: hypothetical protein BGO01_07225 [Armatimonadetes bacterium 55-13]|nr:site-2 protease family protein [Armatimonadota bacterium]OJU62290.1 MAG: hypothetical protein BGO01_07225 [Armatimonadetes bacterium 55-13]